MGDERTEEDEERKQWGKAEKEKGDINNKKKLQKQIT